MATEVHVPHPIDLHVGAKIRLRRHALNISQDNLAKALGLTFQQVQKYERGANRVSASKLFEIAKFLEISPIFFFPEHDAPNADEGSDEMLELMGVAGGMEMLQLFSQLTGPQRKSVAKVTRVIVKANGGAALVDDQDEDELDELEAAAA